MREKCIFSLLMVGRAGMWVGTLPDCYSIDSPAQDGSCYVWEEVQATHVCVLKLKY